ncbi:MAG: TspO/MBR family protein [Nibricoccus sp.]
MSKGKQLFGLVGWLALSYAAASVGAIASINAREFYAQLSRPAWAPPGSVFGPVWSILYTLMAIAAWVVWRKGGWRANGKALWLFVAQLAANSLWSWLFFAWHLGAFAFVEVIVLWLLIAVMLATFWHRQRLAGVLLLPYILWVTFASVLCFVTWRMNPSLL